MSLVYLNPWTWPNYPRLVKLRTVRIAGLVTTGAPGWTRARTWAWSLTWRTSRTSTTRRRASWSWGKGSGSSLTAPAPRHPPQFHAVQRFVLLSISGHIALHSPGYIIDSLGTELDIWYIKREKLSKQFVWITGIRKYLIKEHFFELLALIWDSPHKALFLLTA